jgi:hypothetical protein
MAGRSQFISHASSFPLDVDGRLPATWKAEGDSVVINWDSGWVTKITKEGDKFTKQTFEKGQASGAPRHTAGAQKM